MSPKKHAGTGAGQGIGVSRKSIVAFRRGWRVKVAPRVAKVPKPRTGPMWKVTRAFVPPRASLLHAGWGHGHTVRRKNTRPEFLSIRLHWALLARCVPTCQSCAPRKRELRWRVWGWNLEKAKVSFSFKISHTYSSQFPKIYTPLLNVIFSSGHNLLLRGWRSSSRMTQTLLSPPSLLSLPDHWSFPWPLNHVPLETQARWQLSGVEVPWPSGRCHVTFKSPKVEATKTSINNRMDAWMTVYAYSGILLPVK